MRWSALDASERKAWRVATSRAVFVELSLNFAGGCRCARGLLATTKVNRRSDILAWDQRLFPILAENRREDLLAYELLESACAACNRWAGALGFGRIRH
jgi:hypothetical protein